MRPKLEAQGSKWILGPDRSNVEPSLGFTCLVVDASSQGVRKGPKDRRAHQFEHLGIISLDQGTHFTSS